MKMFEQARSLMQCAALLAKGNVSNESSFLAWWDIVKFAHKMGYLYVGFDELENVELVVIAYRVREVTEKIVDTIPDREIGNTLYVRACASMSENILKLTGLMHWYFKNNKKVNEIAFHARNSNSDLRRYKHGQR